MEDTRARTMSEAADPPVLPPVLFLGGLVAGAILELILPIGPGLAQGNLKAWGIGLAIAVTGAAIAVRAVSAFRAAKTGFRFDEPTRTLVTHGLHGVSRNPIYIGLIVFYAGLAIALTSGWALILLPGLIAVLQGSVIEREEAFLGAHFGVDYLAYAKRVPRWL